MTVFNKTTAAALLLDYIAGLPKKGRGEMSRIAKYLQISTTLVSQILAKEKSFTPEQGQSLATYLGLGPLETEYLAYLIQKERAGSEQLRVFWNSRLIEVREKSQKIANRVQTDRTLSEQDKAVFYSSPLYSAARLFCSLGEHGKSIDEVAQRFDLSGNQIARILNFLVETGLCVEHEGRYFMGAQKTHVEQGSPHLLSHYRNWRLNAIQQSEHMSPSELMYTSTVSLAHKDFTDLREEMVLFIKKFLEKVHASPAEDVACFNMDFFWVKK